MDKMLKNFINITNPIVLLDQRSTSLSGAKRSRWFQKLYIPCNRNIVGTPRPVPLNTSQKKDFEVKANLLHHHGMEKISIFNSLDNFLVTV